jgi:hypothetical protein
MCAMLVNWKIMITKILKKRTASYSLTLTFGVLVSAWLQTNLTRAETLAENQTTATAMAAQEPALPPGKLKDTPWHLVDLWWNLGTNTPFESYSIDVDILDEVPTNINLYLSPVGFGKLNAAGFYGGLQTHADGHSIDNPEDRGIGRGLIFSRWDERDPTAVRAAAPGGYFQSAGNEGDYVSVRAPYEWTKGRYTYRVVKMDHSQVHAQDGTWVGAFVYSYERHENAFVGALWFKDNDLVLDKSIASFVEIYGATIPVTTIPTVRIRYENPTVNGKIISWPGVDGSFDKGIPDIADVQWKDGGIEISVNATNQIARQKRYYTIHQAGTGAQ